MGAEGTPIALSLDQEQQLWQQYVDLKDVVARQRLIAAHLVTAKIIAAKLFALRPSNDVEFADYMQYATIGLIESVDRYDPRSNASFRTFASYRIHGAVLNGIEHLTERFEQGAFKRRLRRERLESLQSESAHSDLFHEMVDIALGLALGYMLDDSGMYCDEDNHGSDQPYESLELKLLQRRIGAIVEALPNREKLVIQYHYFHYMNFSDIADVLGLSKGRVSQVHLSALTLLRRAYESWGTLNVSY